MTPLDERTTRARRAEGQTVAHSLVKAYASLRRAVEVGLPDTVDFLQRLVRVPSVLGAEEGAQGLVEDRLRELGFAVRSLELDAGSSPSARRAAYPRLLPKPSLPGRDLAGGGGPTLLLNGHVDVVSEEPADLWSSPLRRSDRGGRLYGRGACDMKGGIAAMLLAVEAAGAGTRRAASSTRAIEEECGGNGTLAACISGPSADGVVIAEPTNGGIDCRRGRHLGADHDRGQSAARLRHGRGLPSDRDGGGRRRGPARSRGGAERRARAGVRGGGAPLPPERRRPACRRLAVDDPDEHSWTFASGCRSAWTWRPAGAARRSRSCGRSRRIHVEFRFPRPWLRLRGDAARRPSLPLP